MVYPWIVVLVSYYYEENIQCAGVVQGENISLKCSMVFDMRWLYKLFPGCCTTISHTLEDIA